GRVKADVTDPLLVGVVARDHDAVISAVSPPDGEPGMLVDAVNALIEGARDAGVGRVIVVGGAGSLEASPGVRLMDTPQFPRDWRPVAEGHAKALDYLRDGGDGVEWTFVSPAAQIEPGRRTGRYRIGTEQLLTDAKGNSRISMEDYAVALVDELERGHYKGRRMTVAY
ncbi:MAG: NAD(P)-dependent oxidoreductase, partial [Thermoplasmatota archaeon]